MGITLIGKPQDTTPAYNPIYWYFNSSNKSKQGFRYIVDVWVRTPNTGLIPGFSFKLQKRLRIPPRPIDGYCVAEISKTLQGFLTAENPNATSSGPARDSYVRYELQVGEEYANNWTYNDYEFYSSGPQDPWNSYVKLTTNPVSVSTPASLIPHTYVVGDRINIDQSDGGAIKPALQGLHDVVAVPDQHSIVINVPFSRVGSGPAISGSTTYADGRKTIFSNIAKFSNLQAWNGTIPHRDFPNWTIDNIELSTIAADNRTLITNCPQKFKVYEDTIQFFLGFSKFTDNCRRLFFQTDTGKTAFHDLGSTASEPFWILPVGPKNTNSLSLSYTSGTAPLLSSTTQWYEVWTADANNQRTSKKYRFEISRSCQKWDRQQIIFLDRLGALGSFSFEYKHTEKTRIDRSDFKFLLGDLSGSKWTYNAQDFGDQVVNVNTDTEYQFNTAWLNQEESDYFQELMSSPLAYVVLPQTNLSPAGAYPVILKVNGSERKMVKNEKNVKYDVTVKLANRDLINW